ncbi:hypothetical protein JL721_3943 [Aureococcus anophagefferens]|nr:hypothetical protein JL721_3943 [Aureococcus anophagefferens]
MASNVDVDMAAANADAVAAQMDAMDVERVVEDDDGEMLIEDEGEDLGANYLEDDGSIEDGGDDGTFASLQQRSRRAAAVYCCAFAPNGDALTGGGDDRAFLHFGAGSGAASRSVELGGHTDSVTTCGFSHTGTFAATGSYDGTVKLWDATTGNLARTLDGPGTSSGSSGTRRGDVVLCGSGGGTCWMWLATSGGCMRVFAGHEGPVLCGAFTCDGKQIVTGSADGSVRVWAPKKGVCKHAWLPRGHGAPPGDRGMLLMSNGAITALDVHPSDPELVAAAAEDGTAVVLHCKSKKIVNVLEHAVAKTVRRDDGEDEDPAYAVVCVAFSRDPDTWVATGSVDGFLKVWDFAKLPARPRVSLVHNTAVVALAWFPKAAKLVSSSADLSVKVPISGCDDGRRPARRRDHPLLPRAEEYKKDGLLKPRVNAGFLLRVVVFPALGGLLYGFDIGATSYCVSELERSSGGVSWGRAVGRSALLRGLVASASVLGAFCASFLVFAMAERIGRRGEMVRAAACFGVGTVFTFLSAELDDARAGITCFLLGRAIYGCGCALATHAAPAYIAEMAPACYRGACVSSKEALIVVGMLFGYAAGYATRDRPLGWREAYAVALPISCVYLAGVLGLPRSGRWLALRGKRKEAARAYGLLYERRKDAGRVLGDILADIAARAAAAAAIRARRRAGAPDLSLTEAPAVAGDGERAPGGARRLGALAVAFVKLVATVYSCATVERHGRRKLLGVGISVMTTSLVVLSLAFALSSTTSSASTATSNAEAAGEHPAHSGARNPGAAGSTGASSDTHKLSELSSLVAMFGFVSGYQIGFGPIAWLLLSELFGNTIRGKALAFGVQLNFGANLAVSLAFPSLLSACGGTATFVIFALLSAYAAYFVRTYVPETRGLTLEQIQKLLESGLFDPPIAEASVVARPTARGDAAARDREVFGDGLMTETAIAGDVDEAENGGPALLRRHA